MSINAMHSNTRMHSRRRSFHRTLAPATYIDLMHIGIPTYMFLHRCLSASTPSRSPSFFRALAVAVLSSATCSPAVASASTCSSSVGFVATTTTTAPGSMASHRQASFIGSRRASFSSTVSLPGSATERPATSLIFSSDEVAGAGLSPDTTVLVGKKSTLTSLLDDTAAVSKALGVEGDIKEASLSLITAAFESIGGKSGSASTFVPSSGGVGGSGNIQKVAFVAVPDTVTRNNHPLSVHSLTDSLGRVTPNKGDVKVVVATGGDEAVTAGSIGLAIAKAFPLYSRKTKGGKPKDDADRSIAVTLLDGSFQPIDDEDSVAAMSASSEGARLAARLVDTPPEELTTTVFAAEAAAIAEALGDSVTYDEIVGDELFEKGYGGIHAVGRCAVEPPRLVILKYEPETQTEETQTIALVGKGIIYDTGGLSLKSKTGMCGMKGDVSTTKCCYEILAHGMFLPPTFPHIFCAFLLFFLFLLLFVFRWVGPLACSVPSRLQSASMSPTS